ncbi:hypothetical protein ACEN9F_03385 [Duganella sp. CT11-25]|uniref:hypothetical protein n=1 Tax=unclassified Duganella TaxID=2636909 RepID=UPI0039AF6059
MSLLWPETITVGLFGDRCWLRRDGGEVGQADAGSSDPAAWLCALETMLNGQRRPVKKFSSLHMVVSDSACMLTHLPWQDELHGRNEIQAYAQACFAHQGGEPVAGWVVKAGFRKFRAAGLAYAVQQDWLSSLLALTQRHGLRLRSVLPASAAAYWYSRTPRKAVSLVLLAEPTRMTAHLYDGGCLLGLDVQPVTTDLATAGTRLLRRVALVSPRIVQVQYWQATRMATADDIGFIAACLPEAEVLYLDFAWRIR